MQRDVPHRCYGMTLGTDRNTALGCGSGTQNRTSHQSLHRRASSTPATTNADYARAEMPTIFSMMSLPSLPTSNLVRTECSLGDDHRHRHTGHDHALRIRAFGHHTGSRCAGNPFGVLSWLRSASLRWPYWRSTSGWVVGCCCCTTPRPCHRPPMLRSGCSCKSVSSSGWSRVTPSSVASNVTAVPPPEVWVARIRVNAGHRSVDSRERCRVDTLVFGNHRRGLGCGQCRPLLGVHCR